MGGSSPTRVKERCKSRCVCCPPLDQTPTRPQPSKLSSKSKNSPAHDPLCAPALTCSKEKDRLFHAIQTVPIVKHVVFWSEQTCFFHLPSPACSKEKDRLFHAIQTVPVVKKKAEWALKWISRCALLAAC